MKIVKEIDQNILNDEICLIPTMGALHEGHLSLIKKGKEFGVSTMVTIFINELQFDSKIVLKMIKSKKLIFFIIIFSHFYYQLAQ